MENKKQTAVQKLRKDLIEAMVSCNTVLDSIGDEKIKSTCKRIFGMTINSIIGTIDEETIPMEREQMSECFDYGDYNIDYPDGTWGQKYPTFEDYYTETYNTKTHE